MTDYVSYPMSYLYIYLCSFIKVTKSWTNTLLEKMRV